MKPFISLCAASSVLLLTACTTTPRQVSMTEIKAIEQLVSSNLTRPSQPETSPLYIQPTNKAEPCKLPSSQEQLERKGFRAYWDGDCKNGYAYGLGRDISLSDTHHREEITIYQDDGDSRGQPRLFIDYVQNFSAYGVKGATALANSGYSELITQRDNQFSVQHFVGATDDNGLRQYMEVSAYNPVKVTVYEPRGYPAHVLLDYTDLPATSDQAQMALFAADPISKRPIGFRILRFHNGVVQHQRLAADGETVIELVQLPAEYINQLQQNISSVQNTVQLASSAALKAQQMEREYLYMACANNYSIKRVPAKDLAAVRKICTWRNQWREPMAKAEAAYQQYLKQAKQQVAQTEQQRAYLANQQAQAEAAQQAAFAASMMQFNQGLQQQNNQIMQQVNQMNQQLFYQSNQGLSSPKQNQTTFCNKVGNQLICH